MPLEMVQALDASNCEHEAMLRQGVWWASKAFQPAMPTAFAALPPAGSPAAALMYNRMSERRPSDETPFLNLQGRKIDPCSP